MQNNNNILEELKFRFNHGGMFMKLIFINVTVFLCISLLEVFGRLLGMNTEWLKLLFGLQANFYGLLFYPWGLFTSIFAHFHVIHLLMNMILLYFVGKILEQFFGPKRLLTIYLLGGIAGGILEILAHEIFPLFANQSMVVVGASGSIMAIFMALAFYRPNLKVMLFGVVPVRLILLAGLYLLYDALSLGLNDGTAHFAHIGGAIIGFVAAQQAHNSVSIFARFENFFDRISSRLNATFTSSKKPKMKVYKGGGGGSRKVDYEYNEDKKAKQEKTDAILDKISKSGYESLTKAEKDFLFNQSKNG